MISFIVPATQLTIGIVMQPGKIIVENFAAMIAPWQYSVFKNQT